MTTSSRESPASIRFTYSCFSISWFASMPSAKASTAGGATLLRSRPGTQILPTPIASTGRRGRSASSSFCTRVSRSSCHCWGDFGRLVGSSFLRPVSRSAWPYWPPSLPSRAGQACPGKIRGSAHRWLYRMPLTRLGDFSLGMLGALLYTQTRTRRTVERAGAPLAIGAMAAVLALMAWPALLFTGWSWDIAYAIPAAIFIFGLASAPASLPARMLSLPFLVLLGEASYAFYLVHAPAIAFLGGGQWANSVSLTTIALEALTLGAILALAVGLHITFEGPSRTYLRRALSLARKRTGSGGAPA